MFAGEETRKKKNKKEKKSQESDKREALHKQIGQMMNKP
jgi:hypothetical protein